MQHVESFIVGIGAAAYYVEPGTDGTVPRERNRTGNRLLHKPGKRDPARSEEMFAAAEGASRP